MIESIHEGLKQDGFEVPISKLCLWFGVPRRTVYYKSGKIAVPKVDPKRTHGTMNDRSEIKSWFTPVRSSH